MLEQGKHVDFKNTEGGKTLACKAYDHQMVDDLGTDHVQDILDAL